MIHAPFSLPLGEYMLHEVSDTEDSFSADEDEACGGGGGEEAKKPPAPYIPLGPTIGEGEEKAAEGTTVDEEEEDKGDPEMAAVYLKRLLPVFAELFHTSLAPAFR